MLETLTGAVTEAVFGYLLEQAGLGEKVRVLLKRDPQHLAFQLALTRTYATFDRQHPQWTHALFDEHFLAQSAAPLLARCLLRSDPPTGAELAALWATHLGLQAATRASRLPEATGVAADFLATLDGELRARDEFQPLFDHRALDATAAATAQTAEATEVIAQQLQVLRAELRERSALVAEGQAIHNPAPNQGAQGIFHGPVYFNYSSQLPPPVVAASPAPPPRKGINPFVTSSIKLSKRFYGRDEELADIKCCIGAAEPACVSVIGMKYSGKSSLLFFVEDRIDDFCTQEQKPVVVYVNLHNKAARTLTGLVENLHRGIKRKTGLEFWEFSQSNEDWPFQDGLWQLYNSGYRLIVLLDEFDSISHRLNDFQGWGEDWHAKATEKLLTIIIASRRPLRELYDSCGLVSPFNNIFSEMRLGALDSKIWIQMVQDGFVSQAATVTNAELDFIDDVAGGIPYYTHLAAQIIWRYQDHQQALDYFRNKALPHFEGLWNDLSMEEQNALLYTVGFRNTRPPTTYINLILKRQGLIRPNGYLFSSVFTEFVRTKNTP